MLQRLKNWLGFGRRSLENPATPLNTPWYGPPTLSGIAINEWTADTYSAFWCAVRTISVDAASLKYQPVKDGEQGGVVPATDHWSYRLVTHSPDGERPAHRFWATLFQHGLTWGNGYAYIRRKKSSEGYKLELLPPNQVIPRTDSTTFYYQYVGEGDIPKRIMPFNMIHLANPMSFDGRVGKSIVQTARESIGLGLGADLSMAAWYGNAVRPGGHYKIQPGLPEKAQANLREYVDALHAGPLNNGRPGIHPPGLEWMASIWQPRSALSTFGILPNVLTIHLLQACRSQPDGSDAGLTVNGAVEIVQLGRPPQSLARKTRQAIRQ